jgi:hypothetical protein
MDAGRLDTPRLSRRSFLLLTSGLLVAACSKGSSDSASGSSATQAPAATSEPTRPPATPVPSPTATAAPAAIDIRGSEEFKAWTQQALDLLRAKAPLEHELVMNSIAIIESVAAGSGIFVQEKRFRVGEQTAYAPGHPRDQQLIWYAGAMVHDANHRDLFAKNQPYSGKDAEVACLKVQKAALLKIETTSYFSNYIQGLIDTADTAANPYWTQPNRHW